MLYIYPTALPPSPQFSSYSQVQGLSYKDLVVCLQQMILVNVFQSFHLKPHRIPAKWERNKKQRAHYISVLKHCLTFKKGLVQQIEALGRWNLMIVCSIVGPSLDIIF